MRRLLYFLLFAAMLTLNSCSQDENSPEEDLSPVVGEWYTENIGISGTSTETRDGQSVTIRFDGNTGSEEDSKMIFHDDNTYIREDSYSIMFSTMVDEDHSLDLVVYPYLTTEGTYHIQDNKINFITNLPYRSGPLDPRDSFEGTILELTANRMVIYMEHQDISNVDGAEVETNYEMTQIFRRQLVD